MKISGIDNGKVFDFGNTSKDYAKYRDIYPKEFYQYILDLGLCKDGQKVLDIGTNLYPVEKYKPMVNNLKLLKSINNDIPKFKPHLCKQISHRQCYNY